MKLLALILACVFTFQAQAAPTDDLKKFGEQMSNFYLSPSKESFDIFQKKADLYKTQLKSAGNGADLLVAVMMSKASQAYGWQIGNGEFAKIAKEISEGKSDLARYVANDQQVDPKKLDIWWASFFATGETRYLENIFQFAGREPPKGDMEGALIAGAATWSFKANCRQHLRIQNFAKLKLATYKGSESKATILKECISNGLASNAEPKLTEDGQAQRGYWRDSSGKPIPESEFMKSKDNFGGSILITIDDDWREKWETPPETHPNFNTADVIPYGKPIYILIFFANPKLDEVGKANIRCDIKITAPTGKVSLSEKNMTCFAGNIPGSPSNMYLSEPVVAFKGNSNDPPGKWLVEVSLSDANRNIELPLKAGFLLK